MYAVIKTGGKQYKVSEGDLLQVEKIDGGRGDQVEFKEVLMTANGDNIEVGTPVLPKASVMAEIVKHGKGKKIIVLKKIRRKGYRKKQGHRQPYTNLIVREIKS